jgi:hypothetical protein
MTARIPANFLTGLLGERVAGLVGEELTRATGPDDPQEVNAGILRSVFTRLQPTDPERRLLHRFLTTLEAVDAHLQAQGLVSLPPTDLTAHEQVMLHKPNAAGPAKRRPFKLTAEHGRVQDLFFSRTHEVDKSAPELSEAAEAAPASALSEAASGLATKLDDLLRPSSALTELLAENLVTRQVDGSWATSASARGLCADVARAGVPVYRSTNDLADWPGVMVCDTVTPNLLVALAKHSWYGKNPITVVTTAKLTEEDEEKLKSHGAAAVVSQAELSTEDLKRRVVEQRQTWLDSVDVGLKKVGIWSESLREPAVGLARALQRDRVPVLIREDAGLGPDTMAELVAELGGRVTRRYAASSKADLSPFLSPGADELLFVDAFSSLEPAAKALLRAALSERTAEMTQKIVCFNQGYGSHVSPDLERMFAGAHVPTLPVLASRPNDIVPTFRHHLRRELSAATGEERPKLPALSEDAAAYLLHRFDYYGDSLKHLAAHAASNAEGLDALDAEVLRANDRPAVVECASRVAAWLEQLGIPNSDPVFAAFAADLLRDVEDSPVAHRVLVGEPSLCEQLADFSTGQALTRLDLGLLDQDSGTTRALLEGQESPSHPTLLVSHLADFDSETQATLFASIQTLVDQGVVKGVLWSIDPSAIEKGADATLEELLRGSEASLFAQSGALIPPCVQTAERWLIPEPRQRDIAVDATDDFAGEAQPTPDEVSEQVASIADPVSHDEAPADAAPADEASADEAPADAAPADEAPADAAPADEAPADAAPADEASADVAPADAAPADVAPADVVATASDVASLAPSDSSSRAGEVAAAPVENDIPTIREKMRVAAEHADPAFETLSAQLLELAPSERKIIGEARKTYQQAVYDDFGSPAFLDRLLSTFDVAELAEAAKRYKRAAKSLDAAVDEALADTDINDRVANHAYDNAEEHVRGLLSQDRGAGIDHAEAAYLWACDQKGMEPRAEFLSYLSGVRMDRMKDLAVRGEAIEGELRAYEGILKRQGKPMNRVGIAKLHDELYQARVEQWPARIAALAKGGQDYSRLEQEYRAAAKEMEQPVDEAALARAAALKKQASANRKI